MSLLTGAAKIGAAANVLGQLSNALFPDEIRIRIDDDDEVTIDAMQDAVVETSVQVSEFPAEDGKVFVQNISKNPRRITLQCVLSNIIRLSNIKTLSAATAFGTALVIPEVASVSNILLNEEDSISIRLNLLRNAMEQGKIVQILGLPDQDQFNFIIENVVDNENVQTGDRARGVNIVVREAFIVGLDLPRPDNAGLFSEVTDSFTGLINSIPDAMTGITS